ncbi:MAG: hypothetical protein JRN09_02330 [Nitrososphaerota archaeon]|nr:hypothetical protein [Nitrososphaerota archaeon]
MTEFQPRPAQPGGPIRSEDWNYIQRALLAEIVLLRARCDELQKYIDNMSVLHTMTNLESTEGRSYALNETVPGELGNYGSRIVGLISRQWVPPVKGEVGICRFTVTNTFDQLDYWAGAEGGNKKALDVRLNYADGSDASFSGLFTHEVTALAPAGDDNPFVEYILSPSQWVWYRYRLNNPHPEREVISISFANAISEARSRVGNVVQLRARVRQLV